VDLPIQTRKLFELIAIADPQLFGATGLEDRFHRLPHVHQLPLIRQGGMQHQAIEIAGPEVPEGGLERLHDLVGQARLRIIRHPLRILAVRGCKFALEVEISADQSRIQTGR
jgi:hypothetical protein